MRQVISALLLMLVAGCSVLSGRPSASPPAASAGAEPGPSAGASAAADPGSAAGRPSGSASDKQACARVAIKAGEWGKAFAGAAAGLPAAGDDVSKVQAVVTAAKAANSKFATELRGEASRTGDADVKRVTSDLAAALDKISSELDAAKIAKDHNALTAVFDQPGYAAAAAAYEKVCAS